jgi:hypothetical protein
LISWGQNHEGNEKSRRGRRFILNRRKIIEIGMCALLVLGLGIAVWWYEASDPLISDGLVTYRLPNEKGYVVGLSNKGYGKIDLLSVKVNGEDPPGPVWLGVAYDSLSEVQIPPEPDPNIRFMNIKDSSIYPKLTVEEIQEALKMKKNTPMRYGVRIVYDESQPINSVIIRYKYLGFTKAATITRWFENN